MLVNIYNQFLVSKNNLGFRRCSNVYLQLKYSSFEIFVLVFDIASQWAWQSTVALINKVTGQKITKK